MGVITAPVPASGSWPAWIARVEKPPASLPCCCSLMAARLTARSPRSAVGVEDLHRVPQPDGARLEDAEDRPSPGVQRPHRAGADVVVHEAAGRGEAHHLQEGVT